MEDLVSALNDFATRAARQYRRQMLDMPQIEAMLTAWARAWSLVNGQPVAEIPPLFVRRAAMTYLDAAKSRSRPHRAA